MMPDAGTGWLRRDQGCCEDDCAELVRGSRKQRHHGNDVQPGLIDTDLNPSTGVWGSTSEGVTAFNRYGQVWPQRWWHSSPSRSLPTSSGLALLLTMEQMPEQYDRANRPGRGGASAVSPSLAEGSAM